MPIEYSDTSQQQQFSQSQQMRILRELSLSNTINQLNHLHNSKQPPSSSAAATHSILAYKLKLDGKKCQNFKVGGTGRIQHQALQIPVRAKTQIKRRISTAGNNNRFPKDFFRPEPAQQKARKQTSLLLKWGTGQRMALQNRHKQYSLNMQFQEYQSSAQPISTPKFNQPNPDCSRLSQNQFLHDNAPKISPFPKLQQLKLDEAQDRERERDRERDRSKRMQKQVKNVGSNFVKIKKIKKGEFLKTRINTNRSGEYMEHYQNGGAICSVYSMQ